ncbi:hypothetical protein DFJ74DRAFT_655743 [Hyaloraphidium curvatum]|nr:hypothetical protein DFJ74DRAFT_655743 [Hyaloraphidium curvatum]
MPRRPQRPAAATDPTTSHTAASARYAQLDERRAVLGGRRAAWADGFFAAARADGALRVWDSAKSDGVPNDVDVAGRGNAGEITAVAGGQGGGAEGRKKKRRKSSSSQAPPRTLFAIGTASGAVLLYDPAAALIAGEAAAPAGPVLALCFAPDNALLAVDAAGNVSEWDLEKLLSGSKIGAGDADAMDVDGRAGKEPGRSFRPTLGAASDTGTALRSATVLVVGEGDSKHLFVSHNAQLGLFSPEGELVKKFRGGHAEAVSFTAAGEVGGVLVAATLAEDEMAANLWSLDPAGSVDALATVALPNQPLQATFLDASLLLTTSTGPLHIAALPDDLAKSAKKKGARKLPDPPALRFLGDGETDEERVLPVLAVVPRGESLLTARGALIRPRFEALPAEDLDAEESTDLERPGESMRALLSAGGAAGPAKKKRAAAEPTILSGPEPIDLPAATAGSDPYAEPDSDGEPAPARPDPKDPANLPLGERLAQLDLAPAPAKPAAAKPARLTAPTLLPLLVQSLRSSDPALLDSALSQSHQPTIRATLRALPAQWILSLVSALDSRIRARPARARALLPWLRALLLAHAGYLASHPAVASRLGALEGLLRARAAAVAALGGLAGRLEVALRAAEAGKTDDGGDEEGMAVYREGEEEEMDDDEEGRMEGWDAEEEDAFAEVAGTDEESGDGSEGSESESEDGGDVEMDGESEGSSDESGGSEESDEEGEDGEDGEEGSDDDEDDD